MTKLLFILAILATAATAQDCPVRVDDIFRSSIYASGFMLNMSFHNDSSKEVTDSSVAVAVLDSAGDPHVLTGAFDSGKVKAGTRKRKEYPIGRETLDPAMRVKFEVWPTEVKFSDGTAWKDDGSHMCLWKK